MLNLVKALLVVLCGVAFARAADVPAWRMVWSDEFALADGAAPASTNWSFDIGGGGWGNIELESYTSRRVNSRIEAGALVIEALKENYAGPDGIARNYTSARLKTQGKWSWTYGRFEARIKVPRGQGIWPAFWMLGNDITTVNWPACGEIDVMENIGREPTVVYGAAHGPGYSSGDAIDGQTIVPGGAALADAFHLFAVEWETNRIRWFFDNVQYFTITPTNLPAGGTWVFNKPEFLLLNVAVGGRFPGDPDATTVFPQRMTVDYVRVYTRTNAPAAQLIAEKTANGARVSWPIEFPNARLQGIVKIGDPWQDASLPGAIQDGRFVRNVSAGIYRLRWQ